MIRTIATTVFILSLGCYAFAQQPASTPREQALTQRLINEIDNHLACSTSTITLQAQIAKLQDELKAKTESGAEPAKKQDQLPKKQ